MRASEQPEATGEDVVHESIVVGADELSLIRPRSSEALLDEDAFEHEEYLPYWAELWPSALGLARALAVRSLRAARTLELGCGLGLASVAAARAGGRVLATDWSPPAIEFTRANAARNGAELEAAVCSWAEPGLLIERAPWDLVIGSDLLYERRNCELLIELLPRLVGDRGEVWIADPGRPPAARFLADARRDWSVSSRVDADLPIVTVHRLLRAPP